MRTTVAVLAVSALLGAIDAWSHRYAMNPDGVCYLDLGDDFVGGDWHDFVNAHWSPLYPVLLGTALRLAGAPAGQEFQVVHAVNFLIYLYAVACAWAFVRQLLALRRPPAQPGDEPILTWVFFLLFWAVALRQVGLAFVTPDMLFLGTVLLCLALLLRVRHGSGLGLGWCALLGLCAGLGYLAKAPLLPLFPFLVLGVAVAPNAVSWRPVAVRAAAATAAFLVVATPWVACLHQKYGRLTFSESGNLNRLWVVGRSAPLVHWQGDPTSGTPEHPTRVVLPSPTVYEFARPVRGTYPPWKDPAYWMAGARPGLDLAGHLRQLRQAGERLGKEVFSGGYILLAIAFLVGALVRWQCEGKAAAGRWLAGVVRLTWPVLLFAGAGLLMFSLVLVENRYVGSFWFVLCALLAWALALPPAPRLATPYRLLTLAAAVPFVIGVAPALVLSAWLVTLGPESSLTPRDLPLTYHQRAAAELRRLGVEPDTPVAVLGGAGEHEYSFNEYWARLCRARIVAEVPAGQRDLLRKRGAFRRALAACRAAGARFAVLTPEGAAPDGEGTEIPGTRLRLFDLR